MHRWFGADVSSTIVTIIDGFLNDWCTGLFRPLLLFDLHEFVLRCVGAMRLRRVLRGAPRIEDRNLVHAGHRAVRRAAFFREIFAADIVARVSLERNARIAALLRTIVHQPVFADIEIARAGAAAPVIRQTLGDVVLKRVDPREAALFQRLHLVINPPLFVAQGLQLPAAVVNDSDGRA